MNPFAPLHDIRLNKTEIPIELLDRGGNAIELLDKDGKVWGWPNSLRKAVKEIYEYCEVPLPKGFNKSHCRYCIYSGTPSVVLKHVRDHHEKVGKAKCDDCHVDWAMKLEQHKERYCPARSHPGALTLAGRRWSQTELRFKYKDRKIWELLTGGTDVADETIMKVRNERFDARELQKRKEYVKEYRLHIKDLEDALVNALRDGDSDKVQELEHLVGKRTAYIERYIANGYQQQEGDTDLSLSKAPVSLTARQKVVYSRF